MTDFESSLFTIVLITGFITCVLFVLFGQATVRKLRKTPETKGALGIEFASGWDILNVAKAFAMPKVITKKWKKSPQSAFYADLDLLHKHTNKFDRILGAVFYWIYAFTGLSLILLVLMDWIRRI
ncbi:MAG: hypothetical protein QM484_01465 [Woeseiaceae bacterium]